MVFKDYKVKNTFVELQANPEDSDFQRQRRARSDCVGGDQQEGLRRSPLVLASKSPTVSPQLQPVDETRQAVPIDEVNFELLEEAVDAGDGKDVVTAPSRPRGDSNGELHVAQAPSGIGKDEPAYVVPTTPSPFLHSAFNPAVVPPFGAYGYPMQDMGLPPALGLDGDPHQCPGVPFLPPEAYDPSFGFMYGWPGSVPGMEMDVGALEGQQAEGGAQETAEAPGTGAKASASSAAAAESPETATAAGAEVSSAAEARSKDKESRRSKRTRGTGDERAENGARSGGAAKGDAPSEGGGRSGADRGDREKGSGSTTVPAEVEFPHAKGTYTTVMLRNIPNKYTREMLIKQLSQDFSGQFDFMYLPIDFKNKCNVGYGFINFRTPEYCDLFVMKFHGVDVRKCLPGLNSRKIVEVTPARVQGLIENVRRLKNSPVMNQLVDHPEWMPLLFNEDGEQEPFPNPDQPLPPVKPRGKHRGDKPGEA
eukprot:TRINITY_DN13398_c1_g3_i1.p1 TRINITY_DN13398_c1_g3~~TRINITY_DN13398_c1_g3_i1.p1  ORF type:complete len:480 (+),score=120.26 TRINITY_DN13398_c1_g3_i1:181-1620(+)